MSNKNLDRSGRMRNKTVAFRVSEEARLIDIEVMLSGMTKQDYIIARLLKHEVVVRPGISWYFKVRNAIKPIYEELQRLERASDGSQELWEALGVLSKEFVALRGSEEPPEEPTVIGQKTTAVKKHEDAPIREESCAPKADRTAHQIINRLRMPFNAKVNMGGRND